jgi:hypothetical protein
MRKRSMKQHLFAAAALAAGLAVAGAGLAQPAGGTGGGGGGGVRQACSADMQKLCPDAKPGPGGGMRECMKAHFADLSDGCKTAINHMRQSHGGANGGSNGGSDTAPPPSQGQ